MGNKDKEKKLAIFRAWPWISNCWEWDSNLGLSGIESSALTTRPRRLGANLRRDATSRLLFLDQSVLADFDPRKKKSRILRLVAFQARVISGIKPCEPFEPLKSSTFRRTCRKKESKKCLMKKCRKKDPLSSAGNGRMV